jgi:hypothetical protein
MGIKSNPASVSSLAARTVGELFQVLISHESMHLGAIQAMTKLV